MNQNLGLYGHIYHRENIISLLKTNPGYVFDPAVVVHDSGDPATKLLAICESQAINDTFPGWKWTVFNTKTGLTEQTYRPWNTLVPACGKLLGVE